MLVWCWRGAGLVLAGNCVAATTVPGNFFITLELHLSDSFNYFNMLWQSWADGRKNKANAFAPTRR